MTAGRSPGALHVPPDRRFAVVFFFAVGLLYLSLSPFTISHMGYTGEEIPATRQLLGSRPGPVQWPRNGAVGLLLQLPFVAAGDLLAGSEDGGDRLLALQPVLASALLVTMIFVWGSRLAGSRGWGLTLALIAAFGTMIWPYAYIGLETTQSLFLLLAAYLALEARGPRTWPRSVLFGLCAAVAVSAKSNGVMLLPAVGFLIWAYFRRGRTESELERPPWWQAASVAALVVAVFCANGYLRSLSWARFGGAVAYVSGWRAENILSPLLHLAGFLGSPNKGLLVYAPVAILGLLALPRAFAADRRLAIFAVLTCAGLAGGFALLDVWSDETWGPRYLHSCVAPLVLCLAAARREKPARLRSEIPLAVCAVLGFVVSLLGALFYYGSLSGVAFRTVPVTIGTFQGDPIWNHVRFNARLLKVWLRTKTGRTAGPELLRPGRPWNFHDPSAVPPWNPMDLRAMAVPQARLLQSRQAGAPPDRGWKLLLVASAFAGLIGVAWTGREVLRRDRAARGS